MAAVVAVLVAGVAGATPAGASGHCGAETQFDCSGFERAEYQVAEDYLYIELAVFAAFCCPVAQGQIDYETVPLSASAGPDFQDVAGTLTFVGGGRQDVWIPITKDARSEGPEQFEVRLTNFRGTFVARGHERAVVTIVDEAAAETTGVIPAPAPSGAAGGQASGPPAASPRTTSSAPPTNRPTTASRPTSTMTPSGTPSPTQELALGPSPPALQPGPGFELTGDAALRAAPAGDASGRGSNALAAGLAVAAAGGGGVLAWRRRRWSPARP